MLTRWTFDVLREATEMMTSRQIALKIAEAQGLGAEDKEKLDRIRASVDTNLRKKVGKTVEKHGDYPCYWKLIDFDDRPDAMPSKP